MLACEDAREVSHLQRFEGVRQFDRFGRPLGVAYHLRLRAKLVEADVYGPASAAGRAPRHRRFRLTMQLLREDAVSYIPIWQQLIDQGLPTEVYVLRNAAGRAAAHARARPRSVAHVSPPQLRAVAAAQHEFLVARAVRKRW